MGLPIKFRVESTVVITSRTSKIIIEGLILQTPLIMGRIKCHPISIRTWARCNTILKDNHFKLRLKCSRTSIWIWQFLKILGASLQVKLGEKTGTKWWRTIRTRWSTTSRWLVRWVQWVLLGLLWVFKNLQVPKPPELRATIPWNSPSRDNLLIRLTMWIKFTPTDLLTTPSYSKCTWIT